MYMEMDYMMLKEFFCEYRFLEYELSAVEGAVVPPMVKDDG